MSNHIHRSPEGISAATLQKTASEEMPSGQQRVRGSYRAPVAGDAPRHQPRVNPRRTRSARTSIPLRGMVAKVPESSVVWPRSAAFNRMVRCGFCYTDFCWRDGGILTPVIPLTHLHKICIICVRKSAPGWLIVKNRRNRQKISTSQKNFRKLLQNKRKKCKFAVHIVPKPDMGSGAGCRHN